MLYVRTTFLPDDETCFHLFEAVSAEVVEEACNRAELGRARVVPAIEAFPTSASNREVSASLQATERAFPQHFVDPSRALELPAR